MKITSKKVAPDIYAFTFDGIEVVLEGADIKKLLIQAMQVLAPGGATRNEGDKTKEFLRHIKNANDVGIQKLILIANHEDLLVLLKTAEDDSVLTDKFYSNMSDKNRKMFEEDLSYEFKEGVPKGREREAMNRLMVTAKTLESDGSLVYQNVMSRT